MSRNRIAAFTGPADGENPNGFRQVGPNGTGRGGSGGDEGQQYEWGGNVAGAPWAPPDPYETTTRVTLGRIRRR
jgi:hypothetical protein